MQAALFDLDGVIFNTEPQYTIFWGEICKQYHPNESLLEQRIKGQTLVQIFKKWFCGPLKKEQKSISQRLNSYERKMDYCYVAGFQEFVTSLKSMGIRTAVVTSSNRQKMEAVYKQHPKFRNQFDVILTAEDFIESKPSPQCYLLAAQRLNVAVNECIVFEDSLNGLKAGKAAQMYVIGLSTTNSAETIKPLCDRVISDFNEHYIEELLKLTKNNLNRKENA